MKKISLIVAIAFSVALEAQEINIIPQPFSIKQSNSKATFSITAATQIVLEGGGLNNIAAYLNNYFEKYYSTKLKVVKSYTGNNAIRLNFERLDKGLPGAYNMTVNNNGVYIGGDNEEGVFYGIQTLIQLLPISKTSVQASGIKLSIPQLSITDYPRFVYRGMHLDVGRHFFPVDFIKKYIDYLALHKLNTFHWHLTEDQGWRIEIKKYPKLTTIGAWRNGTIIGRYPGTGSDNKPYGGFYTQEEIKEVVQYAKERYIDVIPEIEMPGHSSAAIAAYPWLSCFPNKPTPIPANMISQKSVEEQKNGRIKLVQETWGVFDDVYCAGNDSTFMFLENVLDEVIKLFPSKYIHIGGDESPKTHWKICPKCQQRIKELGLKDEHELQSWFIQRIEKYLNSKGKTIIGWDEILEGGLAPNAVVMSWRGETGGIEAAQQKHKVIMTPGNPLYFDHSQSENEDSVTIGGYNPIEKVYAYDPVPKELNAAEGKYILGAQANVWTEYMDNPKKVEYMIFPRMAALSEILWSPKEKREPLAIGWKSFEKRLQEQMKRYDLWNANYRKAYFDLKATVLPTDDYNGVLWKIESKNQTGKIKWIPSYISSLLLDYEKPILITKSTDRMTARFEIDGKPVNTLFQSFFFNKATGKKITLANNPSSEYPGDGGFTLVNGVQNEKGMARSKEFLGFKGTDCIAIIDLGVFQPISSVTAHVFRSENSWIWQPRSVEALASVDDQYYSSLGQTNSYIAKNKGNGTLSIGFDSTPTRFVKVIIKNWGTIPEGNPGAGNKPWLFVDEIEVN